MGWQSSGVKKRVKIEFSTKKQQPLYAEKQGIIHDVINPQPHKIKYKTYADNFSSDHKFLEHINFNFKIMDEFVVSIHFLLLFFIII